MATRVAANDFNGDGISDVIWGDPSAFASGQNGWAHLSDLWYWDMNSAGVIGAIGHPSQSVAINDTLGGPNYAVSSELTGNFDGDGSWDILWSRSGNLVGADTSITYSVNSFDRNYEYGLDLLSRPSTLPGGATGGVSLAVLAGDFNGDGRSDVLWDDQWFGANGPSHERFSTIDISHRVGNLVQTPVANVDGFTPQSSGDFNGDGTDDVLLRNFGTGEIAEWTMHNGTLASGGVISNSSTNGGWQPIGTGDFNHDGTFDILVQNKADQIGIWTMQGGAIASGTVIGTLPDQWYVRNVGDYNGDGTSDVLLRSPTGATTGVWDITNNAISDTHVWTTPGTWEIIA